MNDFNKFENVIIEWIKNNDKNTKQILELIQNHKKSEFWFSSIIGFFYQYGIDCDVDKEKSLEFFLLAINNEKSLIQNEENDNENNEFGLLQSYNIIIGKYLLSLFYYKDIISDLRNLSDVEVKYLKSARKGDPIAQYNLGYCYQHGKGVTQDHNKAFECQ
ncbi:unnamed protein product [Rhizophagus irregularis]|nr:unnamed protein product [Rhizophagus irregularis]